MHKVAIDIGGTNIRVHVFDGNNNFIKKANFSTNQSDFSQNKKELSEFLSQFNIECIGVGMPGPADYENGILINPSNLRGWWGLDVKKELFAITKAKTILFDNDANLMALANHRHFKFTENDILQFFTVSTGVGAGLIMSNKIFSGAHGRAQEVAYMPINSSKEETYLTKGALESFASGTGIFNRAKKYGFKSTKEVFDNYSNNDFARGIIDDGIDALANAIAVSVALIDPTCYVFDGSVARNNQWYVEKAIVLAKTRMDIAHSNNLKWKISTLGDEATILGALALIS